MMAQQFRAQDTAVEAGVVGGTAPPRHSTGQLRQEVGETRSADPSPPGTCLSRPLHGRGWDPYPHSSRKLLFNDSGAGRWSFAERDPFGGGQRGKLVGSPAARSATNHVSAYRA